MVLLQIHRASQENPVVGVLSGASGRLQPKAADGRPDDQLFDLLSPLSELTTIAQERLGFYPAHLIGRERWLERPVDRGLARRGA
jgi:hypothetical protein